MAALSARAWWFFFKQKTAYDMYISDWSSDVCSSDLVHSLFRSSRVLKRGGSPMVPAAPNFFLAYLARGGRPEDQEQHDEREADEKKDLGDNRRRTRDPAATEHCGDQCEHGEDQNPFEHLTSPGFCAERKRIEWEK